MIDILIVKYGNNQQQFEDCLESIRHFTNLDYRIHIHDNNTTNIGFAAAVNRLLSQTSAPYIVLLNPDTQVTADWIMPLVKDAHGQVGIVQPRMIRPDGSIDSTGHEWGRRMLIPTIKDREVEGETELKSCCFGAVLVKRDVLNTVGQLDPRFFVYYEDVDYCLRATRKGWKIRYCPRSTIVHIRHGTTNGKPRDDLGQISHRLLLRKHFPVQFFIKYYIYSLYIRTKASLT